MTETKMSVLETVTQTARNVRDAASAAVWNLCWSREAREKAGRKAATVVMSFLLGVLCGIVGLRMVDVKEEVRAPIHVEEAVEPETVMSFADMAHEHQLDLDAEQIAQMLYGMRKNSERDLRAVCWVLFNRVESPLYPDTLGLCIDQPGQWVCYYTSNPATRELTALAREELVKWENGESGPVSRDTLWFNWAPEGITFREEF